SGVVLDDPILNLITPVDLTWPIFALIYGGLLLAVTRLLPSPDALLLTIRSYTLLLLVRIVVMFLAPFAQPDGMILLRDPVAGLGPGGAMTNDLFFSGHTATMFLFFLTAQERRFKSIFLLLTVLLGVMLLMQHVHYTVDVVAAPFFTFGCFVLAQKIKWRRVAEEEPQLPLR
ncbi:MAG: phosphatase PAP2-related protein, partial [Candidatus Kapaibacterium sp.]